MPSGRCRTRPGPSSICAWPYCRTETRFKPEFFLDIFNLTDEQGVTRQQDLEAGNGRIGFDEPLSWVPPRRLYLGVRLGF